MAQAEKEPVAAVAAIQDEVAQTAAKRALVAVEDGVRAVEEAATQEEVATEGGWRWRGAAGSSPRFVAGRW